MLGYGDFAENLTTTGIELHALAVGTKLRAVGMFLMEVTQIAKPVLRPARFTLP
jgi:MOSC domain-containing protein YiiM